ncbi:MAG: cytochrome c oxidase subunit II [Actinomycetota bacterium]
MRGHTVARRLLIALAALCALALASCANADAPQDVFRPVGDHAIKADRLWDIVFPIAVVIFFLVQGALVFALVRFRHRPGRQAEQFHGNTKLEVILTLVPAMILAGIAIPTVKTVFELAEPPKGDDVINVTVIAHQFWWEYRYPDLGIETANDMHIPTGVPVAVAIKGVTIEDDVIHSFWVPRLAGKQDAVPGRTTHLTLRTDQEGTYKGQCTEFCGLSHANMRLQVIAQSPEEFDEWVAEQRRPAAPAEEGLAAEGEKLFLATTPGCINCHAIGGTDAQGDTGPDLTHFASRELFAGDTFVNNDANLAQWLENPPEMKPGARMPDYGLTKAEIDALVAYMRTLE